MIKTIFEETFDEGFAAGKVRGEARAGQNLVLAVLRKRFTKIPKRIETAIRNMSDPIALDLPKR